MAVLLSKTFSCFGGLGPLAVRADAVSPCADDGTFDVTPLYGAGSVQPLLDQPYFDGATEFHGISNKKPNDSLLRIFSCNVTDDTPLPPFSLSLSLRFFLFVVCSLVGKVNHIVEIVRH